MLCAKSGRPLKAIKLFCCDYNLDESLGSFKHCTYLNIYG